MATVAEVVESALSLILVQASEAAIEPAEAKAAVTRLNRMMGVHPAGGSGRIPRRSPPASGSR